MTGDGAPYNDLWVLWLGRTEYQAALAWQYDFLHWRRRGVVGDTLLLTEHEPVVTLGRAADPGDILNPWELERRGIAVHEASRGGRATYHGPGQLVGYLIADLRARVRPEPLGGAQVPSGPASQVPRAGGNTFPNLRTFVQYLEDSLVQALRALGVEASGRVRDRGVWVGPRKIASIGVAVRGWVTYHGFALNVTGDLSPFSLIRPCGASTVQVTSLSRELGRDVGLHEAEQAVVEAVVGVFGYERAHRGAVPAPSSLAP